MKQISRIVMIGAGNVAFHLSQAFADAGCTIVQVYSRSLSSAGALGATHSCPFTDRMDSLLPGADLYVIAIADDAIPELLKRFPFRRALLAHTSGSTSMEVLSAASDHPAVLYPLQTLSRDVPVPFREVPLCIEALEPADMLRLEELARRLSDRVYKVDSDARRTLHVAAVFACNFVNHMYALSADILEEHGLPFEMLRPLISETARKARQGSPRSLQTGPARRKDLEVIGKHLEILSHKPGFQKMYNFISESIRKMY